MLNINSKNLYLVIALFVVFIAVISGLIGPLLLLGAIGVIIDISQRFFKK